MKKSFKRAGIAVLSMSMLLSMGAMTANAAVSPATSGGQTVTLPATPATAHYDVYQIAAATYDAADDVNIYTTVGTEYTGLKIVNGSLQDTSGKDIADYVASEAVPLAATLLSQATDATKVTGSYGAVDDDTYDNTVSLAPGYYLIKTKDVDGTVSPILFEVKNSAVSPSGKASVVTIDKGIQTNGSDVTVGNSENNNGLAGKTNAAGKVGDKVVHKIVADIPEYSSTATLNTDYFIKDTPSGTTIIDGTDVTVRGTTEKFTSTVTVGIDTSTTADGIIDDTLTRNASGNSGYTCSIDTNGVMTVTLNKETVMKYRGKKVVVDYLAVINSSAVSSTSSSDVKNTNVVTLNYDNKHEGGGDEIPENDRPKDENHVFTVKVDITKTFTNNAHIAGAVIELQKKDGTNYVKVGDGLTTTDAVYTKEWSGLSAGDYKFVETTTPAGYTTANDKEFKIEVTPDNGEDATDTTYVFKFTGDTTTGSVELHNTLKSTLPGTGGMGTVLFTVGGAAVVLLAGALFVVYMKKRKIKE